MIAIKKKENFNSMQAIADSVNEQENFTMADGTVKWFNDRSGYGVIERINGKNVFVHRSQIRSSKDIPSLREGVRVRFEIIKDKLFDSSVRTGIVFDNASNVVVVRK